MSKWIDGEWLLNFFEPYPDDYQTPLGTLRACVDDAPTIELKRGEWIDKGWKGDWQFETDGRGNCWKVFECSVCNGWNTRKTCFCPHCGAKMEGADDEAN